MDATVDAQLRADAVAFTAEDASLLRAVGEAGSVSAAAAELGRSRARVLDRIETLEAAFGPLVERTRGGPTGGGSELADDAGELLTRFDRLRAALAGTASVTERVLSGTVVERDGGMGIIETDGGTIRARLVAHRTRDPPDVGSPVQVGVRSDAVTLDAPADAPPADGTSARNRFDGAVERIDRGSAIASVSVDVDGPQSLVALVTHDSLERLPLDAGSPVVVPFKATATRAIESG